MKQIEISEASSKLAEIVDMVVQTGEGITLTRNGEPITDLVPHRPVTTEAE